MLKCSKPGNVWSCRYTCLTVGDAICVFYNNKKYYIDVVEAKPTEAISVVETDCEVRI